MWSGWEQSPREGEKESQEDYHIGDEIHEKGGMFSTCFGAYLALCSRSTFLSVRSHGCGSISDLGLAVCFLSPLHMRSHCYCINQFFPLF